MPLFNSSDLQRFYSQGENEISTDVPFLVDRLSLSVVAGTPTYQLPDYVASIRRVTYLGWRCDPLNQRNQREVFQSATQQGRPFWYVFNNIGAVQIRLFPAPGDTIAAGTNLWSTDIPTSVIVEYYRATDNVTFILPTWIRRRILKYYTAFRAYSIDGPGSNLKVAQYHMARWLQGKQDFTDVLHFLFTNPRKFCISDIVSSNYYPGEPVLPIDQFGVSVDEGF
jgi:hypothetical protein